ncbi:hypothetical protein V6N13_004731 [Hibiscus sabdariffa]|uniref:Serine aminopeptidase S33 domain-containing protein n=1 Tax=Hibiscus sabdariffa TaxID=183260 RepID=A0ABR2RZE4_9ROSI
MLRTNISLEDGLNEVMLPFFVLHGEADIVTDPEHALTSGEPDENIEIVFTDITAWLDKRCDVMTFERIPHPLNKEFERIDNTTISTAATPTSGRMQSNGRYLCELKRFRMQHRSAM